MSKRFLSIFMVIGISLLVLGACSNSGEKGQETEENKAVATVNGEEIPRSEYESLLKDTEAMYAQQGIDVDSMTEEMKEEMSVQVVDQLVNTSLLLQTSQAEGIEVDEKSVDERMEQVKGQFEDEEKYQEALKESKLDEETLRKQVQEDLLITQYIDTKVGQIEVSESEVQTVYEQYKEMAESQKQEIGEFEEMKAALEQEAISAKKQEKTIEIIEKLREKNQIEVLI
ncbi:SurA N-terminal domain-containing protein [Mesobacillus harenae]|uniref:SurA N-terminal domain-containing protein n=1 Tax=Mesobacillus harenae TaxID=2213203 RepID=UPI00158020DF|nr:SurA N-terminal domain-containing protein [Mesobacillus harenae]